MAVSEASYRPDLPDFGVYAHWPTRGVGWIHPQDISVASRLIPSYRVFERVAYTEPYYLLLYGDQRLRVRPTLWRRVPDLDVRVGDQVELLSDFGRFEPGIATVTEVFANFTRGGFEFVMRRGNMILPQRLERQQFRLVTVRYRLRSGYFPHPSPKYSPPADAQLLNVGDLS